MTDVIGRGVVAIGADTTGATAGIEKVKKSVKSLGDTADKAAARNSTSIDRYIQKLTTQANTYGRTSREVELYTLKLRGASAAQLQAANTALTLIERQKQMQSTIADAAKFGARAGVAIAAGMAVAAYAVEALIKRVGDFQDLAEKMGDTATNVASLAVPAAVGGAAMDQVSAAAVKLNKNLLGVDDESKDAGAAVKALGLDLQDLKSKAPSDQLRTIAQAMAQFDESTEKSQVAVALFGKAGAELLPFLKELGNEQERSSILSAAQIKAADDFSDSQARVLEITKQTIAGFVIDYIPALTETISATAEWIKESGLAENAVTLLRGSLKVAGLAFQTIALIASDVVFVFQGVGREIGAIAAQLVALARLDFTGFNAISEAVKEDAARARKELDKYQARLSALGNDSANTIDASYQRLEDRRLKRPKIKFTGGNADSKNKANEEAKAQLAYDIELIKQESEGIRTIFSADSKVLEAQRAANLINERQYFNEKRNLLILNQQEQERALEKEIARLGQERLTGKDAIDNERKLVKAKAELQKLRTTGDADLKVLNIQEADSIAKIARAYDDARISAKEYLDTIARRNKIDVEGMGKGDQERNRLQGLAAIEDRFLAEKARIERDKRNAGDNEQMRKQLDAYLEVARQTYGEEVRLYNERTIAIEQRQRDWLVGYNEALNNYIDKSKNIAEQSQQLFENLFTNLEDTITQFVTKGKLDIKSLFDSLAADITKSIVKQKLGELAGFVQGNPDSMIGKLFGAIGGLIGGDKAGAGAGAAAGAAGAASAAAAVAALATASGTASATISTSAAASSLSLGTLATSAIAASTALALLAANSGAKAGGDALSTFIDAMGGFGTIPGRAIGGPVSAGGLYRVNERGPELLQVAGKEYLMMGTQGGKVEATSPNAGASPTIVQVSVAPPAGASRETAMQWGATAGRAISRATRRNG